MTYHVELLKDAGYLKGDIIKAEESDTFLYAFLEMTWQGHEFLDVLKNNEVLNKIVSLSKEGITSLSYDVIKSLGKKLLESKAEKLLGLSKLYTVRRPSFYLVPWLFISVI